MTIKNTDLPVSSLAYVWGETAAGIGGKAPSAYLLAQFGLPIILPSSGSIGNNGALTLTTALPAVFANCWMYFPANAIAAGSAAGIYFVQMSGTTAGTIYNNTLSSGAPTTPSSPTPFVTTGPGAYTQTTASDLTLVSLTVPAGAMGANGALRYKGVFLRPNNANSILGKGFFGGSQCGLYQAGSQFWVGFERTLRNLGSQSQQVSINATTNFQTDANLSGAATTFLTVNTANAQTLALTANLSTATDYYILAGFTIEIIYSA